MAKKQKPYNAAEKRLVSAFARFVVYAEIEKQCIKPAFEKAKPNEAFVAESWVKEVFKNDPEAKRALAAIRREVPKIRQDYLKQMETKS
ncbi:hypothetical protein [Cognaticolwellia mytili]|uniref:hypothetical protein n=1 Tax=Cognaticolwellia mytili TaxID=1888913 RepID=UPI000A1753D6|nr:hypothetical protein [Cognaticolwellia mytili]